jgi:3-oxoacid CoA-transferase
LRTTPKLIEFYKDVEPKTDANAEKDMSAMSNRVGRAAQEFKPNGFANLGIRMPTVAPGYLPVDFHVTLQSENGILGLGPYPRRARKTLT